MNPWQWKIHLFLRVKKVVSIPFFRGSTGKISVLHRRIGEKKVACIVVKAKAQVIGVILGEHLRPDFGENLAEISTFVSLFCNI